MRKVLVTAIATLATAMLFTMTTANAAIYKFTFQSSDAELTATGQFTVNAAEEVTSVSGAISGLIPTLADQDRCAQSRSPMDMTRQG
jgi:peptidoglycan hydrolase CwlO-like protein